MMTNLSKWMLYISSYCIVYVFLLGVSVFNGWKSVKTIESKSIAEKASLIFSENKKEAIFIDNDDEPVKMDAVYFFVLYCVRFSSWCECF